MSDESIAILNLCNSNLQRLLRSVVFCHFEEKLQRIIEECRGKTTREKLAVKSQKALQKELQQTVKNKEEFQNEIKVFHEKLCAECTYLKELLEQITKLQIVLLSKIRKTTLDSIEIDVPDLERFCSDILESNSISIFKNVDLFYSCCRKNKAEFNHILDANTETCLNDLTTKAYASFFTTGTKTVQRNDFDRAIEKSKLDGLKPDDRDIPVFHNEKDDDFQYTPEIKVIPSEGQANETDEEKREELRSPRSDAPPPSDLPPEPPDIDDDKVADLPIFTRNNDEDDDKSILSQW